MWVGEGWTARRERVRLLGGTGLVYWAGGETWTTVAQMGSMTAGWENVGRGLCYRAGETWTTVAQMGGRGQD